MADDKPKARTSDENKEILTQEAVDAVAKQTPDWMKPYVEKLGPIVTLTGKVVDIVGPVVDKGYTYAVLGYDKLKPYNPELLAPMFLGLIMMLFGGYFMLLISCIEAFRITGYHGLKNALIALYNNYKRVKAANKKDDEVDDDGDGVADVLQISHQELLARKGKLFLQNADPVKLSEAFTQLYSGTMGVIATLKMMFARTIALGAAIGDILNQHATKFLAPPLKKIVDAQYHKWVDVGLSYIFKSIGISIAFFLQRIIAAFHSALRGGQMFCDGFAIYAKNRGWGKQWEEGYWDEAAAVVFSSIGLYMQLTTMFTMPWLLAIPLAPLLIVENALSFVVGYEAH